MRNTLSLILSLTIASISLNVPSAFAQSTKQACGVVGSIQERIRDCSTYSLNWTLVTRTPNLKEVWRDNLTHVLWGDRLPTKMNFEEAQKACNGKDSENGSLNLKFVLPKAMEYYQANRDRIYEIYPEMVIPGLQFWWTSTIHQDANLSEKYGMIYIPKNLSPLQIADLDEKDSVRCLYDEDAP